MDPALLENKKLTNLVFNTSSDAVDWDIHEKRFELSHMSVEQVEQRCRSDNWSEQFEKIFDTKFALLEFLYPKRGLKARRHYFVLNTLMDKLIEV